MINPIGARFWSEWNHDVASTNNSKYRFLYEVKKHKTIEGRNELVEILDVIKVEKEVMTK